MNLIIPFDSVTLTPQQEVAYQCCDREEWRRASAIADLMAPILKRSWYPPWSAARVLNGLIAVGLVQRRFGGSMEYRRARP